MFGADQFIEFILTVAEMRRKMKFIWTAGIELELRCDHRRGCNRDLGNCKFYPEKNFQGFNGIRTDCLCFSPAAYVKWN